MARKIIDEEAREAHYLYASSPTATLESIAQRYGISRSGMRNAWRRLGLQVRKHGDEPQLPPVSASLLEAVLFLRNQGCSLARVAQALRIPVAEVQATLKQRGGAQ